MSVHDFIAQERAKAMREINARAPAPSERSAQPVAAGDDAPKGWEWLATIPDFWRTGLLAVGDELIARDRGIMMLRIALEAFVDNDPCNESRGWCHTHDSEVPCRMAVARDAMERTSSAEARGQGGAT